MCYFILTGIIHDQRGIKMSVLPLMVKPVSVFDRTSYVDNVGFYAEEIARANKERMLTNLLTSEGVDINEDTSKDDKLICDYIRNDEGALHSLHGDSSRKKVMKINLELLYRSRVNLEATRRMFKTLSVGALVIDRIIECWAEVLNYEEQFKPKVPGSHSCLFTRTRVVVSSFLITMNCLCVMNIVLSKNMRAGMYDNENLFDLRSFDMVLFLILEGGYFYFLVFEMKNPAITLIDNGAENFTRRVLDSDAYINKSVPYY
ncbi:hypothetical protein Hanom_Chr04g00377371 [Helianthus anomalus]